MLDQQLMNEKETSNISCSSEKIPSAKKPFKLSSRTKSDPAIRIGNVRPGLRRSVDNKNKQAWVPDDQDNGNKRPHRGSSFTDSTK